MYFKMFIAKEKFLDRIEQSFGIFKNNFTTLTVPLLIFNLIMVVVIPYIIAIFVVGMVDIEGLIGGENTQLLGQLSFLLSIFFVGALFFMIAYLSFIIPIQLGILKTTQQAIEGKTVTMSESFKYGFANIGGAFRTYWYIFSYSLLVPALVFILGGILLNIGLYYNTSSTEIFSIIGGVLMGVSVFFGIFYAIYRGTKATFALVSAVDTDSFTRDNFSTAVSLTDGKWWRVFWNIFGVAFFGGLIVGLIGGLGESLAFFGSDWDAILHTESEAEELAAVLGSFTDFNIYFFINSLLQTFLNTILGVFIAVFGYVMFRRLEIEAADPGIAIEPKEAEKSKAQEL